MPKVLLVIQPSLSHYREPFIYALLDSKKIDLTLAARYSKSSSAERGANPVRSASQKLSDQVYRLTRRKIVGNFFWDAGLLNAFFNARAELVVLEGNFYNLTTWVVAFIARFTKTKVAFWGHGWKRSESGFKQILRSFFYRLSHAHYFYGDRAAGYAKAIGFKNVNIYVVYNSIYSDIILTNRPWEKETAGPKSNDPLSLIFCGRLTKRHGIHELIQAVIYVRKLHSVDVKLTVIGEGTELTALKRAASRDENAVEFLGAIHDPAILQALYQDAHFAISPGASGLNVIQALGFGVPVIAAGDNPDSGPEIEAVRDHETGLLFSGREDGGLVDALLNASLLSESEREKLGEAGYRLVLSRYTSTKHAHAMADAMRGTLNLES